MAADQRKTPQISAKAQAPVWRLELGRALPRTALLRFFHGKAPLRRGLFLFPDLLNLEVLQQLLPREGLQLWRPHKNISCIWVKDNAGNKAISLSALSNPTVRNTPVQLDHDGSSRGARHQELAFGPRSRLRLASPGSPPLLAPHAPDSRSPVGGTSLPVPWASPCQSALPWLMVIL